MQVIGIVGGVASGKSTVARYFERLGAVLLQGDEAGHEVLRDPEVIAAARDRWGECIIDEEGQIDRSALARIVFGPAPKADEELTHLEQLTHSRIRAKLRRRFDELSAAGAPAVVLDAAVLLKAGWDGLCDIIVFVDATPEIRRQRATARGWNLDDFQRREAAQLSIDEKRSRSDFVVDNSGTPEQLGEQINRIWDSLSL